MPQDPLLNEDSVRRHQDLIVVAALAERAHLRALRDPDAVALWALGLVYCAEYDTGGYIRADVVPLLVALPAQLQELAVSFVDIVLRES